MFPIPAYGIYLGQTCIKYLEDSRPLFFDSTTGNLHLPQSQDPPLTQDKFCVDFSEIDGITTQSTFGCWEYKREREFYAYGIALCISSMFLIATILVYGCSPKVGR